MVRRTGPTDDAHDVADEAHRRIDELEKLHISTFWQRVWASAVAVLPYAIAATVWAITVDRDVDSLNKWRDQLWAERAAQAAAADQRTAQIAEVYARLGAMEHTISEQGQALRRIEQYLLDQANQSNGGLRKP